MASHSGINETTIRHGQPSCLAVDLAGGIQDDEPLASDLLGMSFNNPLKQIMA
jgi:hypothetical protein